MTPLALTYSGSVLGLIGWSIVFVWYLAIAFAAGWFIRGWRGDR